MRHFGQLLQSVAILYLRPPATAPIYVSRPRRGTGPAGRKGRFDMQTTIAKAAGFEGVGLHSGRRATLTIRPAAAGHGIWFKRIDVTDADPMVPALWDAVRPAELCTRLVNLDGVEVGTTEHLMAALAGCGIRNAFIEIDGPEVPILDGSARPFVEGIVAAGIRALGGTVTAIEVLRPVEVRRGDALARLEPAGSLAIEFHIDFADAAIGRQDKSLSLANGAFVRELCDARTFCRRSDVEAMRARGLALGGTMENAVVVDGARVLTTGGLRRADEPVRHKMLDALGDLALAGAPILGRYIGVRSGHAMTNALLRELFADPRAFRLRPCDARIAACLPGAGLHPGDIPAAA